MIPLVDIGRQHKPLRREIDKAIKKVIDLSAFVFGEELSKFESEFARYVGVRYALGVGNGSDALRLAVLALRIGPGDEVISVANTFTATIDCVIHAGAKPVLVDCDEYFNIDVAQVEKAITKKTKAIIPVHLYGQPANIAEIMRIAKKHKLFVIEDCAQAHGAVFGKKKVGSFGDISIFSFYPAKNLGAMGDAGAVLTNSKKLYEKLEKYRFFGMGKHKYYHDFVGFNSRMDSLQAAVLRIKLRHLDGWNRQRREIAKLYTKLLKKKFELPKERPGVNHVYHLYVIKVKDRDEVLKSLEKKGISAGIHYPVPLHLLDAHKKLGYQRGDFPRTEENAQTILSLPIFPGMTKAEVQRVVDALL